MWLRDRLAVAERGLSLLEQKLHILEQELERRQTHASATRDIWQASCIRAQDRLLRANLLGGQLSLSHAMPSGGADITISKATSTGISYPSTVECRLRSCPDDTSIIDSATMAHARTAYRSAVTAAAQHAVAVAAVHAIEDELTATRIRAQGLRRRRIPTLRTELRRVELELDEEEHAETIRLRWVAQR
ncbi:V-type ATP synthase subunit D [Nocardia sp. NPDC051990]|uniref:V-type ATP synthase subunit D n=1 Tax=Nocardia sp. NPDC051990 TaxID=3155285 RepID=UPI00341C536A